jgi:hypothetical protein
MTTRELATHLAQAARHFPFLGINSPEPLLEVVRLELGSEEALDTYVPYGKALARAAGPRSILHILSGNTPAAGLQSLLRGLLLRSHNYCKIPGLGLPEIEQFRQALPAELAAKVEISRELPESWLHLAEAVLVFGSDQTIGHFAKLVRPDQIFVPHGHKISFGIVFDDPAFESVPESARDFSLFDQQGCLSPHLLYVSGDALGYAERLASAMERFNQTLPRSPLSPQAAAQIQEVRQTFAFRAACEPGIRLWTSNPGTDWTVIYDEAPEFKVSCLNRVAYVKPLPDDLANALGEGIRAHLSSVGIWPATRESAEKLHDLGAQRVCKLGQMQAPPFTWHQDGGKTLLPLVRWQDFEF